MISSTIYQRFIDYCQPYRPTGVWRELVAAADCFACPTYGTATLWRLTDEFLEEELVLAGIAKRLPDGLIMNSALVGEANGVVALRSTAEGPPFALLTSAGVLSLEAPMSLPVLHDCRTQELLESCESQLVLGFDMSTVIVLRSLGLPVVTAHGMGEFTVDQLQQFESDCGWFSDQRTVNAALPLSDSDMQSLPEEAVLDPEANDDPDEFAEISEPGPTAYDLPRTIDATPPTELEAPPPPLTNAECATVAGASPPPTDSRPITLILVGWSLGNMSLDQPHALRPLVEWLLQAGQCLSFDLSHFAVWLPTENDLRRIRFCLEAQSISAAARAVQESIDSSLFTLEVILRAPNEQSRECYGYLKALRRHTESVQNQTEGDAAAVKEAERVIHDAIDRDLVEPLIERAQDQDDALDRNLGMAAAHLARELHRLAVPSVPSAFGAASSRNELAWTKERVSMLSKLSTNFRAIVRELRR